jgi:hypothetical protein
MGFTVMWMKGPLVIGSKPFEVLSEATRHAEEQLGAMQQSFGATAVKVVGDDGTPHFLKSIGRNG